MGQAGKRFIAEIGAEALRPLKYFDLSINGLFLQKKYKLDDKKIKTKSSAIPSMKIKISSLLRQSSGKSVSLLIPELVYQKTNYKDQSMDPIFDLHQRNFGNMGEHGAIYFFGKDRVADTEFLLARLNWQKKITNDSKTVSYTHLRAHET